MGGVGRVAEASNNKRGGEGDRGELEGSGKAVASGACQGSVQTQAVQGALVAGSYTVEAVQTQDW